MRAAIFALLLVTAAACGDNHASPPTDDATPTPIDAAILVDAAPGVLAPCLDRPTDLPRPPTGPLPCDLVPPGFGSAP